MSPKRILVVGSGKRVREAVLPVVRSLADTWELAGVVSRTPKRMEWLGGEVEVTALDSLDRDRLREIDLVYLVVLKPAVPGVLKRLAALAHPGLELLLETPVLLPKHLGHAGRLRAFRATHVGEDCAYLPFLPALERCIAAGEIGRPGGAVLAHSGYAYHGVAMLKSLLGSGRVRSARRRALGAGAAYREFFFANGTRGLALEPRDYSAGRILVAGSKGVLADHPLESAARHVPLAAITEGGQCTGFRAGKAREDLSASERELMGTPRAGEGLTVWMDGMKRVGLARMLGGIAAGKAGYAASDALDDALIDYHLEKLGRYRANPLTSARGALSPLLWKALTALAGRA